MAARVIIFPHLGPGGRNPPPLPQLRLPALQEAGGERGHVCLQDPPPRPGRGLEGEAGAVAPWLSSAVLLAPGSDSNSSGLVEDQGSRCQCQVLGRVYWDSELFTKSIIHSV